MYSGPQAPRLVHMTRQLVLHLSPHQAVDIRTGLSNSSLNDIISVVSCGVKLIIRAVHDFSMGLVKSPLS